ncbi:MAG TPA: DUF3795 domain-containing protein, partial [Holophaga sp.]|nr:DUF3795 domain-containing protein [Holophaga sp.]
MNLDSIAYCGLYCDACSFKRAHDDQDLDHMRAMPDRYAPYKDHLPDACPGCRLENQCGPCPIRDCARERALLHCGQCPGLPCERLVRFTQDGVPHHAQAISNLDSLRTLGEAAWLDHQARQWTCSCGSRQSWYRPQCRNHAPAPVPPKTGVFLLTEASEARQAAELAATGHAAMWTSLPFLPVRSPAHFLPKMTWMIREGWVIGQFQDGVLEAFLGGCLIEDFRNLGRGAFCPDWCHGAAPGVMAFDAFRALYRELASLWKDQEILI